MEAWSLIAELRAGEAVENTGLTLWTSSAEATPNRHNFDDMHTNVY